MVLRMNNRLHNETSPYLLQHADNPVDWQPWDETALNEARRSGKPILLSIGYSSCHWCHVMAHESFEDAATAAVMNAHFVNIKVDREERPDLDKVYQAAHQLLTRQTGGWPLTLFLDPKTLVPFFAGTYFPKTPRWQLPGFSDLLHRIRDLFENRRDALQEQGQKLLEMLHHLDQPTEANDAPDDAGLLAAARRQLGEQFDAQEGGFGTAPKFPMPAILDRMLRHQAYARRPAKQAATGKASPAQRPVGRDLGTPSIRSLRQPRAGRAANRAPGQAERHDREGLEMVMNTLTKMARGGIYDHLGGGFFRYSTDRQWMIPHFEKMLYDNGQLLSLYADALSLGPDALFADAVRETAEWLLREMRHPQGGFFAALDADSEGEEGLFYLWRRERIKRLLTAEEYLLVETLYGLDKPANFEGKWNFHRHDAWRSVVQRLSMQPPEAAQRLASAKRKLFAEREKRARPELDDKVLTAWNALAIKGLAKASLALDEPAWLQAAYQAADFLRQQLWRDGMLHATWKNGLAKHRGYLDDYANLLDALLVLLSAQWREADARFAQTLADALIENFHDNDNGGFYFTAHNGEPLIHRPKPTLDDAQPPGNGVAAQALAHLGALFGNSAWLDAAADTLKATRANMEQYPAGHCTLLTAVEEQLHAGELIILRGSPEQLRQWRQALEGGYQPWRRIYAIPSDAQTLPPYLPTRNSSEPVAFVCSGLSCSLPITDIAALREEFNQPSPVPRSA